MKNFFLKFIKNNENSDFIFSVLVSLLTIFLGVLISPLGWSKELVLCLCIVNIVFLLIILFIFIIWTYRISEKESNKIQNEKNIISKTVSKAKSDFFRNYGIAGNSLIVNADDIAKLELNGDYKEIWLVTSDLATEIGDGSYSSAVFNNLLNTNIVYRYFISNTGIANLRKERMIENSKKNGENNKNLFFYTLDDNFFSLVPNFDFSIYISNKNYIPRDGYMGYNAFQAEKNTVQKFEIKMQSEFVDAIYAKLDSIKNKADGIKEG